MSGYDYTMERLRDLVMTQYQYAPRQAQMAAHGFFDAMDDDGNGSVSYREFKRFLVSEGFEEFSDKDLFKRLDGDGSRGLDFWEVMSLYYILRSDKPFCTECDDFLLETYFVCNGCRGGPYYFCNSCCQEHNYEMRGDHCYPVYDQPPVHQMQRSQTTNSMVMYTPSRSTSRSSSVGGSSSLRTAYRTFEMALNVANLAAGAAACSIM
ncbi:hypothetical protein ACET3Z_002316 [Daucus carota]